MTKLILSYLICTNEILKIKITPSILMLFEHSTLASLCDIPSSWAASRDAKLKMKCCPAFSSVCGSSDWWAARSMLLQAFFKERLLTPFLFSRYISPPPYLRLTMRATYMTLISNELVVCSWTLHDCALLQRLQTLLEPHLCLTGLVDTVMWEKERCRVSLGYSCGSCHHRRYFRATGPFSILGTCRT